MRLLFGSDPHWRCFVAASALLAGCSSSPEPDGGPVGPDVPPVDAVTYDAPTPDGGDGGACLPSNFLPAPAPAFTASTDAPLSIQVSASGEALGELGYPFTTTPADGQTVFVDGWSVAFTRYLVVLDHVRLNQPGADPSMQNVVGALVAQQDGPWVVNVHAHGLISGAGGPPETADPMFLFTTPTGGGAFNPTVRYAFSFETVPASCNVHNVNLVADDLADLQTMILHHWTKYFRGVATYTRDPAADPPAFANYPRSVAFAFGFADPAAYINCQNPELGEAATDRGIQPSTSGHVRAQITLHTDHFFWDETDVEGTPVHFDPFAARAMGFGSDPGSQHIVTMDQLMGDNPTALTDALGMTVANRSDPTLEAAMMDSHPPPSFLVRSPAAPAVHDYRDFVAYDARSQGHLNSDGLCYVQPSAPIAY